GFGFIIQGDAGGDRAGNTSATSAPHPATVDTTAPRAPTIGSATASDEGTNGDGLTSEQVLTLAGTAEIGTTVEISYEGTPLATVIVDGSGDWTYNTVLPLVYATHSFSATATDAAGNTSSTAAVDLTVGPSTVYDLTFLGPGFGFIIQGDAGGDRAGNTSATSAPHPATVDTTAPRAPTIGSATASD
ncbi:MAG: hypothetical protein GY788_25095, partial [bacterium]|nr:hypothetical protein [bacterium]